MKAEDVIKSVGLSRNINKFTNELSGGTQQRVSIARAIMKNSKAILCDEPTGALDSKTGVEILKLLKKQCDEDTTFLMVMIGVMACTGIEAYMGGMKYSGDKFYSENNLFDLLSIGENFTNDDLEKVKTFDNVKDTERKLTVNAKTDKDEVLLNIETVKDDIKESNNALVSDSNTLLRFIEPSGKFMKLESNNGVYITRKLAELDEYEIGDKIKWHIAGSDTYYESTIVGFNKDPQNQNISMTRAYYESLGLNYKEDTIYTDKKINKNEKIEGVDLIQDKNALKESMNNMFSTMLTMISLIIFIDVVLGVIIIYNLSILSYSEKQYQFATLKVLGFKDKQIKNIFIKQNNWITIVAILIGLPLGYFLVDYLFQVAIEEHYDFNVYIR